MIKNKNPKSKVITTKKEHVLLWGVIIILVILQGVSIWYLFKMRDYQFQTAKRDLYDRIKDVEETRYQYPIIDVAESRVYIPEAHVYLPLNDVTRNLRYEYLFNKNDASLHLSTSSIVGAQNDRDDATCDKVIVLNSEGGINRGEYKSNGNIFRAYEHPTFDFCIVSDIYDSWSDTNQPIKD